MAKCADHGKHINAFVDLNGIPYLLAEYLDKRQYQQIDRSVIKSSIFVDQSDAMRAVVDISIDDIGKNASNGHPSVVGNSTKQKHLLSMISRNREKFDHQIPTLRRGLVLRVHYQLEDHTNGMVIRSLAEDFRINDRCYFLDINPVDVNDNAIIVNFSDSFVSTMAEFTHGRNLMYLRITNIQMYYECVTPSPKMPRIKQSLITGCTDRHACECDDTNMYQYHDVMQSQHVLCQPEGNKYITPTTWSSFNRFYHFDNRRNDIVLHGQEINDNMNQTMRVHCGNIVVNKRFNVNPGHRIIFKFCIWKNDVTVVGDTVNVANALRVPDLSYDYNDNCDCDDNCSDERYEKLLTILARAKETEKRQTKTIMELMDRIATLESYIYDNDVNAPSDPTPPEETDEPMEDEDPDTDCDCDCGDVHDELAQQIKDVSDKLENMDTVNHLSPISTDEIRGMFE